MNASALVIVHGQGSAIHRVLGPLGQPELVDLSDSPTNGPHVGGGWAFCSLVYQLLLGRRKKRPASSTQRLPTTKKTEEQQA
mmetsp:Transcript_20409/g.30115  ORF Transcript_20409/g.30115 Transcript_20409/m.30115 type:complete len:82 (+) Transcript_20409:165-410(+)